MAKIEIGQIPAIHYRYDNVLLAHRHGPRFLPLNYDYTGETDQGNPHHASYFSVLNIVLPAYGAITEVLQKFARTGQ